MPTFHNETAIEADGHGKEPKKPCATVESSERVGAADSAGPMFASYPTEHESFGSKAFRHLLRVTAPNAYVPLKDSPEHTASRVNLTLTPTERMLSGKASRARAAMSPRLPVLRQCHSSGAVWTTCLQEHTPDIRETESSWSLRSWLLPRRRGRQGGPERNVTVSAVCCSGL